VNIANILLQVTGDSDDARRELEAVSRYLAVFGRQTAEAEAEVDTTGAKASLDELRARLDEFAANDVSTEINVRIAKALADASVLQAELDRIDGENVTIDVDVRRGIVEKIASLTGQVERLGSELESTSSGGLSGFIGGIGEAFSGTSIFGMSLRTIAIVAPFVITALVAVAGQLLAIVASAASAAGGLGALGVALVGTLAPAFALIGGAIANFKEDSETAGTAAFALKENVSELGEVFTDATSGGSDALFKGLSDAVRDLVPMIDKLKPAFTGLGQAGGDAIRKLSDQFTSAGWTKFFSFLTESLAKLTPLFAQSFGSVADILKNVATAAMPFLISGFKSVAGFLGDIADKTSDIGGLREVIGGMVDSLRAWGKLLGGIADLTGAIVQDFAPFGDSIVESLAEGAHNLADWLRSSKGLEEVKTFFETTGPLASELGKLILNLGITFIRLAEIVSPPMTAIVGSFNDLVGAVNDALGWIVHNAGDIGRVLAAVIAPITVLRDAFGPIGSAASAAFEAVKSAARDAAAVIRTPVDFVIGFASDINARARAIWESVREAITDGIHFVLSFANDINSRARNIWSAVRGVITDGIHFILSLPGDMAGRARNVWSSVKGVISDAINFILSLPDGLAARAHDIWSAVKGVVSNAINFVLSLPDVGGLVSAAKAIWDAINNALPDISIDIDIPTPSLPHIPGTATGVRNRPISGLSLVGEEGPELAFLPKGIDVFNAGETQRMLRALADGVQPSNGGTGVSIAGAGQVVNNFDLKVVSPGTGSPDPAITLALWGAQVRARGAIV
jgi:phage-related protein